jgi:hypothetical protein
MHAGVRKGDFHITDTFIADVFRTNTRGTSPFGSNILKDLLYSFIGMVCPRLLGAALILYNEINVDCLGAVAERRGQTSSWSQRGTLEIPCFEEDIGDRMRITIHALLELVEISY